MDIAGAPCVRDGCRAASDAIARTSLAVTSFVREVRESRSEFDAISTELHSLDGVLDLLASDAAFLPAPLAEQTPRVLEQCLALTDELEGCVSVLNRPGVTRADKKSRWWASRGHIDKLRSTLAEYKLVLGLAVDMVAVLKPQTGNSDDPPQMQDDELVDDASGEDGGLAMVVAQIAEVTNNLHKDFQVNAALAQLGQFLDVLRLQAEAAQDPIESEPSDRHCDRSSSLSGSPDSAIDVSCDNLDAAPVFVSKQTIPLSSADIPREAWQGETGEFVGELREMPPPLPPRSASRLSTVLPGCHALPPPHTADNYSAPRAVAPLRGLKMGSAVQTQDPVQRPDRADSYSPPLEVAPLRSSRDSYYTPVTELPELVEDSSTEPESRTLSRRSSMLGNMLYSVWDPPHADLPSPGRPITSSGDGRGVHRPSSLLRRSSSRLSNTLRNLGRKRPSLGTIDDKAEAEPTDVFGVPLTKSMQVAKGIASTRHGGGGSSVRATREYPLCVLRCVYHIRDCGLDEPDIFGLDGHQLRLPQLKTVFASVETGYGKELDWSRFTVYDAADLILLFLSELPQPLVPESVGKRWISLSRQASIRTARLDQGLDFWEEAFMGIRGHGRALFKLLLNLWGDIADAAEVNGMTAERLAGRVIRPLMHAVPGRDHTDLMLGLAFVIRKRSEYNLAINGVSRRSNAAF